jgi:hypothetical protein
LSWPHGDLYPDRSGAALYAANLTSELSTMRVPSLRYALLPLLAALVLTACHGKDDPTQPGGSTPEAAVQSSVELIKAGNFNGLWKHALPPADYATLRADWAKHEQSQAPITDEDRARFNTTMQQLTGPDAENKLNAELQPKLAAMSAKYNDQIPVLISVGVGLVKNAITQNKTMTAEQKNQASAAVDVLGPWAQKAPWFDAAKAKQTIGIVVDSARKLDLKSPEQLRTMDFDTAMTKYSIGFAGLKQVLLNYGLSVDDTLDSVKVTPIDSSNGHARVKIDYTLLGKPLSSESKLEQIDGRWYSEDIVNSVRESHKQLSQPAGASTTAPAVAGTASIPVPASSAPTKD